MENLNIRKATIEDIVELKKLEAKCFDERIRENFSFVLENKNYLYLVAFFNKNIVAYAGASISYEQGELLSICVDSSYRKQGLATKILKELVKENIVKREQYNEVPPHVEYSLTPNGLNLVEALHEITKWSKEMRRTR